MRALTITNMYPSPKSKDNPLYGIFIKETVDSLEEFEGVQSTVVSTSIFRSGISVGIYKYFLLFLRTFSASLTGRFDVIHGHFAFPSGFLGLIPRFLRRKPLVITTHGSDINTLPYRSRILFWAIKFALKKADAIVAVSSPLKKKMVEDFNISPEKIFTISCGVDTSLFSPGDKKAARSSLGFPQDKTIICHVATLSPVKRSELIIEAFGKVWQKHKNIRLVISGDGSRRPYLVELAESLGLKEQVVFTGYISRDNLPTLFRAADIFMLSSDSEGTPVTVLEAVSSGIPVVSTDVGGVGDVISSSDFGFLARPGDPESLAFALETAITEIKKFNPEKIREKAEKYSWKSISFELKRVYLFAITHSR